VVLGEPNKNPERSTVKKIRNAFTLIELLVVIGIIAVLIGILLPVMAMVQTQSRSTRCLSNLRQISQAAHAYAATNRGRFPVNTILVSRPLGDRDEQLFPAPFFVTLLQNMNENHEPQKPGRWYSEIEKTLKAAQTFRCPSDDSDLTEGGNEGALARYLISPPSYIRQNSEWYIGVSYTLNGGLVNESHDPRFQTRWIGGNLAKVKRSSSMVVAGDSVIDQSMYMYWTPELFSSEPVMTLADVYDGTNNVFDGFRSTAAFDTKRHKGNINLVFVDGHAETAKIGKKKFCEFDLVQGK
jgi:prepilin-type N-terminal cleavage/methylation domain-containing protein/prepilin-type processing-associated H-X9-DG protein